MFKLDRKPLILIFGTCLSLLVSCQEEGEGSAPKLPASDKAKVLAEEKSAPRGQSVCYVDMEQIFALVKARRGVEQAMNELSQLANAKLSGPRGAAAELTKEIREKTEELRKLVGEPSTDGGAAQKTDEEEKQIAKLRQEIVDGAEKFQVAKRQLAKGRNELQKKVNQASVTLTNELWSECAQYVNNVAIQLGYDYVVNVAARDAAGFPIVVARRDLSTDITAVVLSAVDRHFIALMKQATQDQGQLEAEKGTKSDDKQKGNVKGSEETSAAGAPSQVEH